MRLALRRFLLAAASTALVAVPSSAQSPKEIFDRMLAEYERQIAGVDNYTVVQEMMGMQAVMYFEKEIVDGRPMMRLKQSSVGGVTSASDEEDSLNELYAMMPELVDHATYGGRDRVDGHAVHVVNVTNLQDLEFSRSMGDEDFTPTDGTFYVDAEQWIPRRMRFAGEMHTEEGPRTVTSVIDLLDYREVGGMLHPYRTTIQVEGLGEAIDPEMRAQYEEMKQQLADLPESQRAMAERMMKGQMEQIEKMMAGGAMTVETIVSDVRVNQGPPK